MRSLGSSKSVRPLVSLDVGHRAGSQADRHLQIQDLTAHHPMQSCVLPGLSLNSGDLEIQVLPSPSPSLCAAGCIPSHCGSVTLSPGLKL